MTRWDTLSAVGQQAGGVRYRDQRADDLRARYHAHYGDRELPVPVESIAVDLLGLCVDELPLDVSGLLLPAERQIYVNADEPPQRRRFTLAHELGHCEGAEDAVCHFRDCQHRAQLSRAQIRPLNPVLEPS